MKHRKLLIGMIGIFVLGIGGVFVLLHQGNKSIQNTQVAKEVLVAGIEISNSVEGAEKEASEGKGQTQKSESDKQLEQVDSQKATEQITTSSVPVQPSFVAEESSIESQALPQETVSDPDPVPIYDPVAQPTPAPEPVGIININTANSGDLQQLSGIGPVLASKIIEHRKNISLFYIIEDVKKVSGIGDAIYAKIKNNITVGNVLAPPPPSVSTPAPSPTPTPSPTPAPPANKININTANYEELQDITGVGEVIAQRIIDYRQANGAFGAIEEIKNVKGIGDATFEKMKEEIMI